VQRYDATGDAIGDAIGDDDYVYKIIIIMVSLSSSQ
jgi:hypothetical protein